MDIITAISQLEAEWEPDGFFGKLRAGIFDALRLQQVLQVLRTVETDKFQDNYRRFVALTWFIPTFMTWQRDRVQEHKGNVSELEAATNQIIEALYKVLGVP